MPDHFINAETYSALRKQRRQGPGPSNNEELAQLKSHS